MHKPAIGHLYVLEATGGLVKVGFSEAPQLRVRQHTYKIKKRNLTIMRHWVSPRHVEAGLNEEALIASCERLGGTDCGMGREWFSGISFDDAVEAAMGLDCTVPGDDGRMTIGQARDLLGEIIDRARLAGQATLITRQGKPAAVVINVEWYEQATALAGEGSTRGGL